MYRKLLVAYDGSDVAAAALTHAAAVAREFRSEVLLVFVAESAAQRTGAPRVLAEATHSLEQAGCPAVRSTVDDGDPATRIVELASEHTCDLVVLGTHGRAGLKRAALGSVADHVVRHSPNVPVLLARSPLAGTQARYRCVLLPLDGSDRSAAAIREAERFATAGDRAFVVLQVVDSAEQLLGPAAGVGADPALVRRLTEVATERAAAERREAERYLAAVSARLRAAGADHVGVRLAEASPDETILQVVDELGCDLVVMSTHGRGGVARTLLGSVTDHVVRHVREAAVLVVRPNAGLEL